MDASTRPPLTRAAVQPSDLGWRGDPCELVCAVDVEPGVILRRLGRTRPAWMADAACAGTPVGVFFTERGHSQREALQVCGRCPVLAACREWAIADPSLDYGVIGGMSARARKAARTARRARRDGAGDIRIERRTSEVQP